MSKIIEFFEVVLYQNKLFCMECDDMNSDIGHGSLV